MKLPVIIVLLAVLSSCISMRGDVGSDYSVNGHFEEYTSFRIGETGQNIPDLGKIIAQRLNGQGYVEKEYPSFYVYYSLVGKNGQLMTYHQPQLAHWLNASPGAKEKGFEKHKRDLTENTLIISLYDPILKETVWRGYISHDDLTSPQQITSAVYLLLDDFKIVSKGIQEKSLFVSN